VAVDPDFKVTVEIETDVHLVRATSDDFFARPDPLAHLRGRIRAAPGAGNGSMTNGAADGGAGTAPIVDLAFIDGMHLFEFALRDFINVERFTTPTSVVVFDDMLPRSVPEAARDRVTSQWTGDVYKVVDVLRRYRPDLSILRVNTQPTGLVVVFGPDASSNVLRDHYEEILAAMIGPDPQPVPEAVLTRSDAVEPTALLASGVWAALSGAREHGLSKDQIQDVVSSELAAMSAGPVAVPA
jgi:hypothetical protein